MVVEIEPSALIVFQHTAARRRLGNALPKSCLSRFVSTHSRPKAAGLRAD